MLTAGARAYLLKDGDIDELLRVIDLVRQGRTYVSPDVGNCGCGASRLRLPRRLSHAG
jgi:DNA-binding NarL/FixJ family response regulator